MKKIYIVLLILLGLTAICVLSCPDKQAHKDAIMDLVNSKLNQEASKSSDDGWAALGVALGSKIFEIAIDNRLEVKNYFVCSFGQLAREEGMETVSVGILGHVFTISKEDFSNAVDGLMYE